MDTAALPRINLPNPDALFAGAAREALQRALPDFLKAQRWFGGKAKPIREVRVVDHGPAPAGPATAFLTLFEIAFADGVTDLYFMPLAVTALAGFDPAWHSAAIARLEGPSGPALLHDALADPRICGALLDVVRDGAELPTTHGRVRAEPTAAFGRLHGDAFLPAMRGPATSSNSLVFFGDRLLLKCFRRLEPGVNPDYEIGRFLTERTDFDQIPRVAGHLEYLRTADGAAYTVGLLQTRVLNDGDGWVHALRSLEGYFRQSDNDSVGDYLEAARTLGRRTAEMHRALAGDAADPAFAPEPLTAHDVEALRREIGRQGKIALTALADNFDRLPQALAADARRLLDDGPAALESVSRRLVGAESDVPTATKTRIHGDYHLGQTLWVGDDYVLLDFEGEPTRTVEERREKFSPVRDVAGMLRSYHYAAYAGLFAAADGPEALQRLEPAAARWQRSVAAAFLDAYRSTAGGASFLPRDPAEFGSLLDAFMLAKAFYELTYELNNRPDWVRIPLGGVLSLLGTADG